MKNGKKKIRYIKHKNGSLSDIMKRIGAAPLTQKSNEIIAFVSFDQFLKEKPYDQAMLTKNGMISSSPVDYSLYNQTPIDQIRPSNLFDCSHGIISFITYYSNNLLNGRELEFHFSGASQRKSLEQEIKNNNNNNVIADYIDISNIFDSENPKTYFQIGAFKEAFFGVTFKRIKINPTCYYIRAGQLCNRFGPFLTSFTFEGYNEETAEWDILDERMNINDLNPSGGYALFIVKTTDKSYSSFRIHQTEVGGNDFWGFTIAGFDIHGYLSLSHSTLDEPESLFNEESPELRLDNDYDPFSIIDNDLLLI